MIDESDAVTPGSIVRRGDSGYWYLGADDQYHGPFDDEHAARAACEASGCQPIPDVLNTADPS